MGFQFYKRLKIKNGFGLNLSKSGISSSIRTRKGSISTKGYSIKTGIKGLNYRKRYSKSTNRGCLGFVFVILSLVILFKKK